MNSQLTRLSQQTFLPSGRAVLTCTVFSVWPNTSLKCRMESFVVRRQRQGLLLPPQFRGREISHRKVKILAEVTDLGRVRAGWSRASKPHCDAQGHRSRSREMMAHVITWKPYSFLTPLTLILFFLINQCLGGLIETKGRKMHRGTFSEDSEAHPCVH